MEINKNDFISDYVIEAQENLDGIDNAAISLINTPRDYETLKELLRLLHTLKGSSRMMDFSQIEQIINSLETVFKNFQTNRMEVASSFCYLLLNVNEFIRKTIHKIEKQSENYLSQDDIVDSEVENFEQIIQNINCAAEGKIFSYEFSAQNNQDENAETNADKNVDSNESAAQTGSAIATSGVGATGIESATSGTNAAIDMDLIAGISVTSGANSVAGSANTANGASVAGGGATGSVTATSGVTAAGSQNFAESSSPVMITDTKTIKIQISQINAILQNYDKLLMRQIKLKKELSELKKKAPKDNQNFQEFREIIENIEVLENQSVEIQKQIISLRMLPFDMILQPIKRSIFQEALKMGKNIDFDIPNSEITIDKTILENLPPIIMHLARNALDHGIEGALEREKIGKPAKGKVSITVEQVSSRIFVTIKDDGRGIDYEKIRQKALQNFPERAKEIQNADEDTLLQFIFMSGFSTKEQVTALSGRGIGLDVVRTEMEKLKGKIRVESKKNQGCTFELSLPNSLATQDGLFIQEGEKSYLVLSHYVKEILTVNKDNFLHLQNGTVINFHNQLIPVYDFDSINESFEENISKNGKKSQNEVPVVVLEYLNKKIAIMTDKILHYNTVVIKPLPPILKDFKALQGVVFDENYEIIPVLNIPDVMRRFGTINVYDQKKLEMKKAPKVHSILVVDDSHTTRHIEQIILEAEGYKVSTACDGIEALEKMKMYNFDLVISDVKMPRMDGFVLIHNIRHTEGLKNIPVIFITSVFEADTQEKVFSLGANGYIVKSDFERENLVAKVKELLT